MTTSLATFPKGGVHPMENKDLTNTLPIERMPDPCKVSLFLKQHVGAPCEMAVPHRPDPSIADGLLFATENPGGVLRLLVDRKDRVKEGDRVGEIGTRLGAVLHASVGGTVQGVETVLHFQVGKAPAIVIRTDPEAVAPAYAAVDWRQLSREQIQERIAAAGIVGLGGAGFPTDVKLNVKPGVKLDTLILNGAECEPYITCDHRVMVAHAREIVEGARILLTVLGVACCVIGVENNKPDAIAALNEAIIQADPGDGFKIAVKPLAVKYPQGSADQIMQSLTGRIRPSGRRSSSIGIIVQNVYTTKTVYDAVVLGKPLTDRVITVTGRGIARPANLRVKIGTHIGEIVDYLGGTTADLCKVVVGGPMMGFAVSDLDIPITKTTPGVLFLTHAEVDAHAHGPCIRCGFCLDACPMGLEPNNIGIYVEAGRGAETEPFGFMDDCFECGSCAYVCPAKRPLVQFIRLARLEVNQARKLKEIREQKRKTG
ncbi:electron transport complex subunit RsxC [Desulfosarcina sp.]|uniref:electron transport complex subunit RsxC n=1 Tax=Desulfosarcina sp. TaxID=2027861 RepID=UPI003970C9D5